VCRSIDSSVPRECRTAPPCAHGALVLGKAWARASSGIAAGDVQRARVRAQESGSKADLRYVIPREGTIRWVDTLAIPADAPHPAEAHAFIDYLMRPGVAARNANYVRSATVNSAAMPMIDEAFRSDPNVYPAAEMRAKLVPLLARRRPEGPRGPGVPPRSAP